MAALSDLLDVDGHPLALVQREICEPAVHIVEKLVFETAEGERVGGVFTRPQPGGPTPAILYIHAHGNRYDIGADELRDGRTALQSPLGPAFAEMGIAALAIDLPGFGGRAGRSENALAKARLWHGKSLAGQMIGELASALGWLMQESTVDAQRIGAFGISMGATLGYWLAAVDDRIACIAHQCCYADFETLIEAGAHDLHGIYLTVPGLLGVASNGEIAGIIAPRPQLICVGDQDPLTPKAAVDRALYETRCAYDAAGASDRLIVCREPATGHQESPAMRRATLAFFARQFDIG